MTADIRQVSTRIVYQNPWMTLREDEIERADGSKGIYAVVEKPDFALIIPAERGGFYLVQEIPLRTRPPRLVIPPGNIP